MGCPKVQAGREVLNPLFFQGVPVGFLIRWWDVARLTAGGDFLNIGNSGPPGNGVNVNVSITPGVLNGRPVATYNGINSITTTLVFSPLTNFSAFIVVKSAVIGGPFIGWTNAGAVQQVLVTNAGENLACFDGVNHPTSVGIDMHTNYSIIGVVCSAGACVWYQNGGIVAPAAGGVLGNILNIANFGAVGAFFSSFSYAECVFYTAPLIATEIAQLTEYFRGKFNLF